MCKGLSCLMTTHYKLLRAPTDIYDKVYRCFQYKITIHLDGIWIHYLSMPSLPKPPRVNDDSVCQAR